MEESEKYTGLEIAVIGLAGRFPSSRNIEELWENLRAGKELISFFSDEELREQGISENIIQDNRYVKAKGFLEDAELFDASFFDYTDREANLMDPQLRIFHECVQEALENAGYGGADKPITGLFAGAGFNPFWVANFLPEFKQFSDIFEISSLNAREYLATRVAYKLDLKGPAVTVQTACSTSLVAIHMGVQSLLAGECNMALAGGASVLFPSYDLPRKYGMMAQEGLIIAPDGHCRPFDQNGVGFMGGDGTGVVVLKRLEEAITDGDNVLAIIKGSAVNNDGNAKVGYTAPSIDGQSRVIRHALDIAEVDPKTIQYIETHGSGTPLGDPVEVEGLKSAYPFEGEKYCHLGSIKSNMGHTDAAAGVAGFIKTVLSISRGELLPTVNHEVPNEKIDFENSPFTVSTSTMDWPEAEGPRRAAVSSFGIGGTNAHIILEEGLRKDSEFEIEKDRLLLVSAKSSNALKQQTDKLYSFVRDKEVNLSDLAYTSQVGRGAYGHRHAILFEDKEELLDALKPETVDKKCLFLKQEVSRSIVFAFQGLGGQYVNMGLELYHEFPVFRGKMDEGFSLINELTEIHLKDIIYPDSGSEDEAIKQLQSFEVAQLATFTFESALAELLMSLDIKPDAMIGYSFGELVALHVGNGLSFRQALQFVIERGKIVASSLPGRMLSVPLSVEEVKPRLLLQAEIAIDNGDSCVVSGPEEVIDQLEEALREDRILSMPIPGQYALHSSMMSPLLPRMRDVLEPLMINPLDIPLASNITGNWVKEEVSEAIYWEQQLSQTVQFVKTLELALTLPNATIIEIGPGSDLVATIKRYLRKEKGHEAMNLIRPQSMQVSDKRFLLGRIRRLWLFGVNVQWEGLHIGEKRNRIPMPTYAFDRKRYWFKDQQKKQSNLPNTEPATTNTIGLAKDSNRDNWLYLPSWEKSHLKKITHFDGLYCWLIFSDGSDDVTQVIKALEEGNQRVVQVTLGKKFQQLNLNTFQLNPAVETQYQLLFNHLKNQDLLPERILHWWNVETPENLLQHTLAAADQGYFSLINIALALHQMDAEHEHVVFNITKNTQAVFGDEAFNPLATLSLGASKVIPIEFDHIKCINLDFDSDNKYLSTLLVDELKSPDLRELMVAFRCKTKWTQTFRQEKIHSEPSVLQRTFSGRKVFLIVGGLTTRSNLGYLFAKYFATKGNHDIVFLSRTKFPNRENWSEIDNADELYLKIQQIKELEAMGASIHTYVGDLTQLDSFRTVIGRIETDLGSIDGVINVAGIMTGDSMDLIINRVPKSSIQKQFDIKVRGTINLFEVLKDWSLDFCVFSSSLTAVMGPFSAYAAANNFMDAFTYWVQEQIEGRWLTINWDHLLGFKDQQEEQPLAIDHGEIIESFERILSGSSHNQVLLSTTSIDARIDGTYRIDALPSIRKKGMADWYYQPVWTQVDLSKTQPNTAKKILLIGKLPVAEKLEKAYKKQGISTKLLTCLEDESQLSQAFESFNEQRVEWDEVHFICSKLSENLTTPYYELLRILKAWIAQNADTRLKLRLVMDQSFHLNEQSGQNPELAALLGPATVIGLENPNIEVQYLDVELESILSKPENLLSLTWEFEHKVLAFRNERWFCREYQTAILPEVDSKAHMLKSDGFYLISGGLGGMALELIKAFSDHAPVNFLLIDNQDFPERSDWDTIVSQEKGDLAIKNKVTTLLDLEMLGTGIMIQTVDVCDQKSVLSAFELASQKFGKLNGLFHIAGGIDKAGIIQRRPTDAVDEVLETKIAGAKNLEIILEKHPVDFAVYFSSTGNIFTRLKFGQASYNAGHEFLDAYVYQLRKKGIKAYSVNFNDWHDTGIAAEATAYIIKGQQMSFEELLSVKPAEGIHALQTILANDEPRIAISAYRLDQITSFIDQIDFTDVSSVEKGKTGQAGERPDLDTPYVAPENETERILVDVFETTFGYTVGVEDDFFELGGDSIKAIAAISALQVQHQLEVPITRFFDLRTARRVAEFLGEEEIISKEVEQESTYSADFHEPFALAPMQKAYIMGKGEHFEMGGVSSNVYQETTVQLAPKTLNDAFNQVLRRHPMLTIAILPDGTQQFQKVDTYQFPVTDLRNLSEGEQQAALKEERQRLRSKVFDEEVWPLFEITVFRLTDQDNYMFFCLDHLIGDAASTLLLIRDWGTALNQPDKSLPEIGYTYRDYMADFEANRRGKKFEQSKKFWLDQLEDFPSAPELPYQVDPSTIEKPRFVRKRRFFNKEEWQSLKEAAKKNNSTPSVLLCTVYAEVLSFWSNTDELALNLTLFNRYPFHEAINEVVGDFTTLVMLGLNPGATGTFKQKVTHTRDQLLKSLDHRFYDGIDFIRELRRHRGLGTRAIMPYVFTSALFGDGSDETDIEDTFGFWSQQRGDEQSISTTSQVYIDCTVSEYGGGMELVWDHVSEIFDESVIQAMFEQMVEILEALGADKDLPTLVPPTKQLQEYKVFNETVAALPNHTSVIDWFEGTVADHQGESALSFEGKTMSYEAFNARSNQLARELVAEGISKGQVVGVYLNRSLEMMTAIYAVMKAGGVYLPLPTNLPQDRIQYILSDAKVAAVLVGEKRLAGAIKNIWVSEEEIDGLDASNLEIEVKGDDPAYLIYTSGSTGQPKGVLIQHLPLVNRLAWMQKAYPITSKDKLLQKTPIGFDVSLWELFWWGLQGAALEVLPPDQEKSAGELLTQIMDQQISVVHFVPTMFELFLNEVAQQDATAQLAHLKYIFCSGEALQVNHVDRFNALFAGHSCRLINLYGPTEATIDVSHFDCTGKHLSTSVPIGKPIDNLELFVLNTQLKPVPHGVSGELYIGGIGLAAEYLNRSELTESTFIDYEMGRSTRLYKTGDRVKYEAGELIFIDRLDDQVKVRGNRIELGEINHHLLKLPGIESCAVIVRGDQITGQYLCAYLVGQEYPVKEIRAQLLNDLPDYMVPQHYVYLQELPLTHNGKLNRKSLPEPGMEIVSEGAYLPPVTEIQKKMVSLWEEQLKVNRVGITDHFFDLGGDSFQGALLLTKVERDLGVKISLAQLFKTATIQELAEHISTNDHQQLAPAPIMERYPLSTQQIRMFVLNQMSPEDTNYNLTSVKRIVGHLDVAKLEHSLKAVIARNEIFRTSFHEEEGVYYQRIHKTVNFEINKVIANKEAIDTEIKAAILPFDLTSDTLLRVKLIKVAEQEHFLVLDLHHIASDLMSSGLLFEELIHAYSGGVIPEKALHYKDYAYRLHHSAVNKSTRSYWMDQLQGELPVLSLPTDFTRPAAPTYEAGRHSFIIPHDLLKSLELQSNKAAATLQMSLMSAFLIFLHKLSDQQDVIIGTPVLDVRPAGLEQAMGMFVNTMVIRNQIDFNQHFEEVLQQVKSQLIAHFEHMDLAFEDLVEMLDTPRDVTRNPIFDVLFVYQTLKDQKAAIDDLKIEDVPLVRANANFDLTVIFTRLEDGLEMTIDYKSALYREATVKRIGQAFLKVLDFATRSSSSPVKELDLMTDHDQEMIDQFNQTGKDYGKSNVMEKFKSQATLASESTAVTYQQSRLTYQQLHRKSEQVAAFLQREHGVKKGDIVGYYSEKNNWTLPVIYGILKAGAVYMPLSVTFPFDRIYSIVEESQPRLLLSSAANADKLQDLDCPIVVAEQISTEDKNFSPVTLEGADLAYIIYTSGSTGKPKGVMISHEALYNRIAWMQDAYQITSEDVLIQKTPLSFDVSIWELFWSSFVGAQLVVLEDGHEKEPEKLVEAIQQHNVSVIHFVPSMLKAFTSHLKQHRKPIVLNSLAEVFTSGEALTPGHIEGVKEALYGSNSSLRLINLYGPTEATVDVTHYECSIDESEVEVPIGRPISNIQCHVLNKDGKRILVGQAGELCLSGIGLAQGYLNNEELTKDAFVRSEVLNTLIYKTGDLVRWLPDGNIEFLGRIDDQVKLRGYRIELGEINYHLSQLAAIDQGFVVSKGKGADQRLVAYYTGELLDDQEIVTFLIQKMPAYMVPQQFVHIDRFPLNTNGKINRKLLPEPELVPKVYVAPTGETAIKLTALWKEVLDFKGRELSADQSFFSIGGNSLKAVTLISKVNRTFGVNVPFVELFNYQTIQSLADFIDLSDWLSPAKPAAAGERTKVLI